jgi:hypothetical protein
MPHDAHRTPLTSWSRPVVAATVLACRDSMGAQPRAMVAHAAAEAAFLAAGGDPKLAKRDVPLIVSAAVRDHGDWFWRPCRERIAREEAWWKARGVRPPPMDRSAWPVEVR